MQSLRKYLKNQSELITYTGTLTNFDPDQLVRAERDIDKVVGVFYQGPNRKSILGITDVRNAVLTSTTATITDLSPNNTDFYSYSVLEILSGSNKGMRIAIESQANNILTYFDTQTGLSETSKIRVYQEGKFPRLVDTWAEDSVYYKSIPEFIKECVALQYLYRVQEGTNLQTENVQSSYRVDEDSYQESFDTSTKKIITDRISPEALDILDSKGLTSNSI